MVLPSGGEDFSRIWSWRTFDVGRWRRGRPTFPKDIPDRVWWEGEFSRRASRERLPVGLALLQDLGRLKVDDAIFFAFVAEKPCGSVALAVLFSGAFAPQFLEAATMAKTTAEVLVHLIVGADVDGVVHSRSRASFCFRDGRLLLLALPSHSDNRGNDSRHKKEVGHDGDDYTLPER